MKFTGERPTLDHEIKSSRLRYKNILPYCKGKKVLDFGCGVGQGSSFLSHFVPAVIGYEPDPEALKEAQDTFTKMGCHFVGPSFDDYQIGRVQTEMVCAVEVIEHMEKEDLRLFLEEMPHEYDLICTTPNGDMFPYHPKTPEERRGFHVWHYTINELYDLFEEHFKFVEVSGHLRDPALKKFTGYTVFATNQFKKVTTEMLEKVTLE